MNRLESGLCIMLVVLVLLVRLPFIHAGLPYLYNEDEAHHFNRVVEMAKSGNLNPHYFHKPSVHFYMRLPVVVTSFFWTVKNGHIRSIQEIKTRDPFGLAGYNFSASHPGIVKWNRAFSVLLCAGSLLFIVLITAKLSLSFLSQMLALCFAGFSPELIHYSTVIGVDMPLLFLVTATSFAGLCFLDKGAYKTLWITGLLAGLSVSTKYNALPVMTLPLIACLLRKECRPQAILISLLSPVLGFFLGSPAILLSLPLFLDQFAYEIWHYGIAGHQGHSAEPGFMQAIFYTFWLGESALGWVLLIAACCGFFVLLLENRKEAIFLASFPLLFFLLMISQKANFERNMLVLIPYLSIAAVATIDKLKTRASFFPVFIILAFIQPYYFQFDMLKAKINVPESRFAAKTWIEENTNVKTALDGELQFEPFVHYEHGKAVLSVPGLERVSFESNSISDLYAKGFRRIVISQAVSPSEEEFSRLQHVKTFEGNKSINRILINPEIRVYNIKDSAS